MGASYISPRAVRWIQATKSVRVLHQFDQVCNLVNEQGHLLSLVTAKVGMGPFFWLIETSCFVQINFREPIHVDAQRLALHIGSHTIKASALPRWEPKPDWMMLCSRLSQETDSTNLCRNSLNEVVDHQISTEIKRWMDQLLEGIASQNLQQVEKGSYQLAGRGIGLTPTGDDILLGILYALWTWQPEQKIIQTIAQAAIPRTTTLSAAFIRAAAAGEATIHWHNLANGQPYAIKQICAIGHTSGRDAWQGFVQASQILKTK